MSDILPILFPVAMISAVVAGFAIAQNIFNANIDTLTEELSEEMNRNELIIRKNEDLQSELSKVRSGIRSLYLDQVYQHLFNPEKSE